MSENSFSIDFNAVDSNPVNFALEPRPSAFGLSPLAAATVTTDFVLQPLIIEERKAGVEERKTDIEEKDLTIEARLQTYLDLARQSQHNGAMENAFTIALRTQRAIVGATLSNTMPTAMKIQTCEIPVLKLFLEFGQRSPQWRALVIRMLNDNVESGTGHLTVNRAKQVLKELAKRAGIAHLTEELNTTDSSERRFAAIVMLGWLKHERAIAPLVNAFDSACPLEKTQILSTLEMHYRQKLAFHLRWKHHQPELINGALLALVEIG